MIIVLEGCDLAGKSTLATALARVTGLEVLHRGPPKRHPLYEYEPRGEWTGICDRWHLGEIVYGPILRGESKLDDVQLWHVDAYLRARGALVVLVHPRIEVLVERLRSRGDDLVDERKLRAVHAAYDQYISSRYRDLALVTPDPTHYANLIINQALTKQTEVDPFRHHHAFKTYVGPRRPTYLLVGDQRQHGDDAAFDSAFVPMPGSSGHFLLHALWPTGVLDTRTGIINANECKGDEFFEAWHTLGRPMTVTLGANAHNKLAHLRIPHGAVPHPQWCKRFHFDAQTKYGEVVQKALQTQEDLRDWRSR